MNNIIDKYREQAKRGQKKIVFPEGCEERILRAAAFLKKENIIEPILIGNPDKISAYTKDAGIDINNISIINPETSDNLDAWIKMYYELRKHKGITEQQAKETLKNPLFIAAFLLRDEIADGAVAGSINATADVLRADALII